MRSCISKEDISWPFEVLTQALGHLPTPLSLSLFLRSGRSCFSAPKIVGCQYFFQCKSATLCQSTKFGSTTIISPYGLRINTYQFLQGDACFIIRVVVVVNIFLGMIQGDGEFYCNVFGTTIGRFQSVRQRSY